MYKKRSYLISSNAKIVDFQKGIKNQRMTFEGEVELKLNFHITQECTLSSIPLPSKIEKSGMSIYYYYKSSKRAVVDVSCR